MIPRATKGSPGLIVTVSSPGGSFPIFDVAYGVGKAAKDRMAMDMAGELKPHNIASVSLWPMAVMTEKVQELAEDAKGEVGGFHEQFTKGWAGAESTLYSGKAVAAIAMDKNVMDVTGKTLLTADLGYKYGFKDVDDRNIYSLRSLPGILNVAGLTTAASIAPGWIKIPGWLMGAATSKF